MSAAAPDPEQRLHQRLGLLASALARQTVSVQPLRCGSEMPRALPPRAVLAGAPARLFVPPGLAFDTQDALGPAMVAHAVAHWRFSPAGQDSRALRPMGQAVVAALEDARVERLLCREHPGVRAWFEACAAPEPPAGDLGFCAFMARLDRMLRWPGLGDPNHWVNKAHALFEAAALRHGLEDAAAFRAAASILANDLGQMRVRMDPGHFAVPAPYRDDNSYLWHHPAAASSPDEALQWQTWTPPPSTAGADAGHPQTPAGVAAEAAEAQPAAPQESVHPYPEWDRRLQRLKAGWCTVIDRPAAAQATDPAMAQAGPYRTAAWALPRARQLDRHQRLRRQWEGDGLDLDAAVAVQVDRRMGLHPEPRLFVRAGKGPRPASLLVLLDASESVNLAGPHGHSLLALEKQAVRLLAASPLAATGTRLAIHAFSSNTRAQVDYRRLLDFGQPFAGPAAQCLDALQGRHSTRLGAALRHASRLLEAEPEGHRHLLVITDGAPSDIDVHDALYLVEDARHAVQQARAAGIRTSCLAVDSQADPYVRRIFGWRDYGIADDARHLPRRLGQMGARLAAGR
jgi:hypothetical protein